MHFIPCTYSPLSPVGSEKQETTLKGNTCAAVKPIDSQHNKLVLDDRPPPISDEEEPLNRRKKTLSWLRSGCCKLLCSYKNILDSTVSTDCGSGPQYVRHLFHCTSHLTNLTAEGDRSSHCSSTPPHRFPSNTQHGQYFTVLYHPPPISPSGIQHVPLLCFSFTPPTHPHSYLLLAHRLCRYFTVPIFSLSQLL